ncbi:AAA family ATPase [Cyanobacteria bacterium FACHB-471]|nr:AAA family ATPase [Cyanobacteria bacterium FACHB-471]
MLLEKLTVQNFRCHEILLDLPIHKLTVFIGENDSGKTALLDALCILLTSKLPVLSDFRQLDGGDKSEEILISGTFRIEEHDSIPKEFCSLDGKNFILTKTFKEKAPTFEIDCLGFEDERFNSFENQQALIQKELLESLGIAPGRNAAERVAQFKQKVDLDDIPRAECRKAINFNQISEYLPRFEYISSSEYKQPDSLIQRTLQGVTDSFMRPIDSETQKSELLPVLAEIKEHLQNALNEKINEITEILKRFYPHLKSVQVNSNIDFLKSFTTASLMLDFGDGPQLLSTFGEGTKKKVWMCLLDWEKQVQQKETNSVFRVYDEPDINLDYSAERKLFLGIINSINVEGSRIQSVVSTHSVTLIDRAPIESIRLIKVKPENTREVEFFDGNIAENVIPFIFNVGHSVGISNSLVLYEKAFLVVEGESEENALPIMYKHLYRRSFLEDGIVLVNLHTYSSWKTTLKFLGRYRSHITVVLLDEDCRTTSPGARLTAEALELLDYPADFINSSCSFIGSKEFEDAFQSGDIVATLNKCYPRDDSKPWQNTDVDQFRVAGCKFGSNLVDYVRSNCVRTLRSSMSKPEFAAKLAYHCSTPSQIPSAIHNVFQKLRQKAGIIDG